MSVRRFLVLALCLLHTNLVLAQAVADMQSAAKAVADTTVAPQGIQGMFGVSGVSSLGIQGLGTVPAEITGFSVMTPEEISGKGASKVTACNNEISRKSMTSQQLAECDAALEAAKVAGQAGTQPIGAPRPAEWATQDKKAGIDAKTIGVSALIGTSFSVTEATCVQTLNDASAITSEETCSTQFPATGVSDVESLSVKVKRLADEAGNPVIDPVTGKPKVEITDTWVGASGQPAVSGCERDNQVCLVGSMCQTIEGEEVCRPCWQRQIAYSCYDWANPQTNCGDVQARGCTKLRESCDEKSTSGACVAQTQAYSCRVNNGTVSSNNCTGGKTCIGDLCFDTTKTADRDFAKAVVTMEAGREAGVYVEGNALGGVTFFQGASDSCTRWAGVMASIGSDCCKVSSGAKNNKQVMSSGGNGVSQLLIGSALGWSASSMANVGSHYMYDFMMASNVSLFEEKAFAAIGNSQWSPDASLTSLLATPSISAYGFSLSMAPTGVTTGVISGSTTSLGAVTFGETGLTFTSGGAVQEAGQAAYSAFIDMGATTSEATAASATAMTGAAGEGTSLFLSFNPYLFVAIVVISVIQQMRTCEQNEILLGMRRGANLCLHTGTECSKRLPWPLKTCIQYRETHCCWNSLLAKEIVTQGKVQLYGAMSGCGGLSTDEFAHLDFSRLNLQPIMDQIMANARLPSVGDVSNLQGAVSDKVQVRISR